MFVTEEEMNRRLNHPDNLCNPGPPADEKDVLEVETKLPEQTGEVRSRFGHGDGTPVDPQFRTFLGIMAQKDTIKNVAEQFGSNIVTVGQAKKGLNSNGQPVEEGEIVLNIKEQIADKVLDHLLAGLDHVAPEMIGSIPKVKDRTGALRDLSMIHTNLAPKQANLSVGKIVIMSPGVGKESDFRVIDVDAVEVGL